MGLDFKSPVLSPNGQGMLNRPPLGFGDQFSRRAPIQWIAPSASFSLSRAASFGIIGLAAIGGLGLGYFGAKFLLEASKPKKTTPTPSPSLNQDGIALNSYPSDLVNDWQVIVHGEPAATIWYSMGYGEAWTRTHAYINWGDDPNVWLRPLKLTPNPTPSPTPAPTPSPTPAPTPSPTPAPTPSPTPAPTPSPTPAPTPSPTPAPTPSPTNADLQDKLIAIAAILAVIQANTTPTAQQTNAKQGVCDAMQPNQCGFEGVKQATTEATAPIKEQAVANAGAISSIANLVTNIWQFLQDKIGIVLKLLNNQVVDRAVNLMNLAVNITNLLMLTESAGKALGGIVDAVFSITPFQFENDKGQKTTASSVFGQNATALVVNIIGADNYASLKENLAVGNRIIKSSTNLLNQTRKLLYQQSKQQQKTGIEVANIANALIDNGVVNQNSYPKAANSPEANAAMTVEDTNIIQGKLGIIKQGIAGLKKITQEINSKVRLVKGIQKTFKDVTDLVDGESKARQRLRNTAKQEADRKSKFKSIHLKQIKKK